MWVERGWFWWSDLVGFAPRGLGVGLLCVLWVFRGLV